MKKKFNPKALPMLVAALTICENFAANKLALIAEQLQWADPYISGLKARIEGFLQNFFGLSSKAQVKEATRIVNSLSVDSLDNLGMVKTQVTRYFKDNVIRRDAILDLLGYKQHWKKASRNNQTELISLLYTFANNLKPELRTELEGKKINPARLTAIVGLKESLSAANITQETLKGSSKLDTEEAIKELNEIYDEIMNICEIAKKLYRTDTTRRELFVFTKIVKAQGIPPSGENGESTPAPLAGKKK